MTGRWKKALEKIWQEPEREEMTTVRQIGDSGSAGNISFEDLIGGVFRGAEAGQLSKLRRKRSVPSVKETGRAAPAGEKVLLKQSERDLWG